MHPDLEEVGSLVTGALVAGEIDGTSPSPRAAAPSHGSCANCGTQLNGTYCHACGQAGHRHRSLLHLSEEVLHGVLHFEAKGWRTLPLLIIRPGVLTRRYIDGQRTRYVSPLALFLFCVFLSSARPFSVCGGASLFFFFFFFFFVFFRVLNDAGRRPADARHRRSARA